MRDNLEAVLVIGGCYLEFICYLVLVICDFSLLTIQQDVCYTMLFL